MKFFSVSVFFVVCEVLITQIPVEANFFNFAFQTIFDIGARGVYLIEDLLPFCLTPFESNGCAKDSNETESIGETKVFLFTRENPQNPEFLHLCRGHLSSNTNFDPKHKTEIFIHGWLDGICVTQWMKEVKDELLMRDSYNVIIVDWHWGNGPDYYTGLDNVYVVNTHVATLIQNIMKDSGVGPDNFHLVGHSFGAHIAGLAGKIVPNLRRITGLEPSLENFHVRPESEKLSPSDATLVDVIHTDAGAEVGVTFGDIQPYGDADFYPNGGTTQLSCYPYIIKSIFKLDLLYAGISILPIFCNHLQSLQYYKSSINPTECEFVGYQCSNYESFQSGQCDSCSGNDSSCVVMGMDYEYKDHPSPSKGQFRKYYLNTKLFYPYCNG